MFVERIDPRAAFGPFAQLHYVLGHVGGKKSCVLLKNL